MMRVGALQVESDLLAVHRAEPASTAGIPVGIICVNLAYPKMPGNVANASTFAYPVMYRTLDFPIEQLFSGDQGIKDLIIDAAHDLQAQGARVVVGACGYFAHFQRAVAEAVDIPVFLSSLCQLPLVRLGLGGRKKIAVFCADGGGFDDTLLANVGEVMEGLVPVDVSQLDSFGAIRWGRTELDNARLAADLSDLAREVCSADPQIGAVLLECSDLPPYAVDIQRACSLPVFDFITLIDWAQRAVVQTRYFGLM